MCVNSLGDRSWDRSKTTDSALSDQLLGGEPFPLHPETGDLQRGSDEPAQSGHLADDPGVVAAFRGRRTSAASCVDARSAADLLQLAAPLELVTQRDRVDRFSFRVEVERGLVDDAVAPPVEVAGREHFADRPDRTGGEHHRAEDRLLGIEILRWNRGGRRSLGELIHVRQIHHLRTRSNRLGQQRSPQTRIAAFAGGTEHMFP
jgi:hypothetical protein